MGGWGGCRYHHELKCRLDKFEWSRANGYTSLDPGPRSGLDIIWGSVYLPSVYSMGLDEVPRMRMWIEKRRHPRIEP